MSTDRQVSREPGGSDTAGSTGFGRVKLVEPGRDEGTARVETTPVIERQTRPRRPWFRLGWLADARKPAQSTSGRMLAGRLNRLWAGSL